jgi:hypothetical protein
MFVHFWEACLRFPQMEVSSIFIRYILLYLGIGSGGLGAMHNFADDKTTS